MYSTVFSTSLSHKNSTEKQLCDHKSLHDRKAFQSTDVRFFSSTILLSNHEICKCYSSFNVPAIEFTQQGMYPEKCLKTLKW